MLPRQRLADLEKTLDTEYRKLGKYEQRIAHTASLPEEFDLEERIQAIRLAIREHEVEYWDVLAQEARACAVEEVDARNAIVEVVRTVELIEHKPSANYPAEFMRLLLEIRDKLNEPGQPAAAKAKLALPLVPGILSYEVELDTENSVRRAFGPIKRLFKGALEKN